MATPTQLAHQLTENVKLLQKVAVCVDSRVLILKRADDSVSRPGCWDLPGGNSEWPAASRSGFGLHRADAVREVLEETGIELEETNFSQEALEYFETFFDADKQVFSVICGWAVRMHGEAAPAVQLSDEHTAYAWITQDELKQYDFGGARGEFVQEIIMRSVAYAAHTLPELEKGPHE